ncbi:MAG: tetratricopeptide repeat protein, partial [Kofleriaceae bacterium]
AADAELALIDTPQALSSRGIIAVKRGDPAARDYAKRAVAQLGGDVIAIRAAISVHALAGDREGAHAVLAEHGHHLDEAGLRAAYERMIDDPEALANSVIHRFPQHAELVLDAIAPMITAGKLAEAEALLRRAATWDPDNVGIVGELGFALSRQGRDDEAIAIYTTAIGRSGAHNLLRFNRANCLLRRRDFAEAANDLRICLAIKPDWHDARVNLISALFAAGDRAGAAAEIEQLEELGGSAEHVIALRMMLAGTL